MLQGANVGDEPEQAGRHLALSWRPGRLRGSCRGRARQLQPVAGRQDLHTVTACKSSVTGVLLLQIRRNFSIQERFRPTRAQTTNPALLASS